MIKQKTASLEYLMPVFRERLDSGQSVRFSPQGTSMLPMLRQEIDTVVISPLPEKLNKYDIPLYQRTNGQYVLHRIVAVEQIRSESDSAELACTYTCMGDNQFVKEPGLTHDQMIGLVTEFYRGGKRVTTDQLSYKLYCRMWYHSRHFRHFWIRAVRKLRRIFS